MDFLTVHRSRLKLLCEVALAAAWCVGGGLIVLTFGHLPCLGLNKAGGEESCAAMEMGMHRRLVQEQRLNITRHNRAPTPTRHRRVRPGHGSQSKFNLLGSARPRCRSAKSKSKGCPNYVTSSSCWTALPLMLRWCCRWARRSRLPRQREQRWWSFRRKMLWGPPALKWGPTHVARLDRCSSTLFGRYVDGKHASVT